MYASQGSNRILASIYACNDAIRFWNLYLVLLASNAFASTLPNTLGNALVNTFANTLVNTLANTLVNTLAKTLVHTLVNNIQSICAMIKSRLLSKF